MVLTPKKVVDLVVFGQVIRIKHEDEQYVQRIQEFINEKVETVEKSQKASSTINVAARTVITLVDELFSMQKEKEEVEKEVEDKAKRLIEFIDSKGVLK